ncbi:MAG: hypothetical protein RIB58_14715 [Phycisphaerales bacterium]
MPRIPNDEAGLMDWAAYHLTLWAGQGVAPTIGVTPEQVAAAQLELDAAAAARASAIQIRAQSLDKTLEKDQKLDTLRATLGGLVTQVDGFAKSTKDESVYVRAGIPEPAPKTPRSEADTPTDLATASQTDGSVLVTFEANKGAGTVFLMQRQIVSESGTIGDWAELATLSDKQFLDENVPTGIRQLNYRVRAQTTNGVLSPWSFPVPFYLGTGGGAGASSSASAASSGGPHGGESITIEDAQQLKDAQTAKGKGQAG